MFLELFFFFFFQMNLFKLVKQIVKRATNNARYLNLLDTLTLSFPELKTFLVMLDKFIFMVGWSRIDLVA